MTNEVQCREIIQQDLFYYMLHTLPSPTNDCAKFAQLSPGTGAGLARRSKDMWFSIILFAI